MKAAHGLDVERLTFVHEDFVCCLQILEELGAKVAQALARLRQQHVGLDLVSIHERVHAETVATVPHPVLAEFEDAEVGVRFRAQSYEARREAVEQ